MKKIPLFFILSVLFVNLLSAAEPENFIPSQSTAIFRFNAKMLINNFLTQDPTGLASQAEEIRSNIDKFKEVTNIDPMKLLTGQVWGATVGSDALIYAKTGISEAEFANLFNVAASSNKNAEYKLSTTTVGNKKAFVATKIQGGKERPVMISYLAEDVVFIAPLQNNTPLYVAASLQGGKNPLAAKIDRQALAAMAADLTKDSGNTNLPQMDMIFAKLNFSKNQDIHLLADMICKNEKIANQLSFQIQMMLPGLIGMMFGQEPELAEALVKGLSVTQQDKTVHAEYKISGENLQKAAIYMAKHSSQNAMPENEGIGPKKSSSAPKK